MGTATSVGSLADLIMGGSFGWRWLALVLVTLMAAAAVGQCLLVLCGTAHGVTGEGAVNAVDSNAADVETMGGAGVWGDAAGCPSPTRPGFIFYNAVPKSGSSMLNTLLGRGYRDGEYSMTGSMAGIEPLATNGIRNAGLSEGQVKSKLKNASFRWRQLYPADVEATGVVLSRMPQPIVHVRHLHLHPDLRVGGEVPAWINMWREPVSRCTSRFYYSHRAFDHGAPERPEIPRARQRSFETVDACVDAMDAPAGERCELFDVPSRNVSSLDYANACWNPQGPMSQWPDPRMPPCWEHLVQEECNELLVRWLCGKGEACEDPATEAAYESARRNLHAHYLFVGVLEELPATMRVFRALLPDLFNDAVMAAWADVQATGAKKRSGVYPPPSDRAMDVLRARNRFSTRLWEEAKTAVLRTDAACRHAAASAPAPTTEELGE